LSGLGFVTKPGRDIGYRSDRGIIETPFKSDGAERGKSVRDPNAEANIVAKFSSLLD
jgi:hypothetical protein